MEARHNEELLNYLNQTKYNFADGIGLIKAINHYEKGNYTVKNRFPGTDFFEYLSDDSVVRVFLFGAHEENNKLATYRIETSGNNVKVVGRLNGFTDLDDDEIVKTINQSQPDILIVCLGCPKQELWINKHKKELDCRIVFGNGGGIDFWSGAKKRAPAFFIHHGLEWVYRLFQDFTCFRIRRQMRLIPFFLRSLADNWEIKAYERE